MTEPDFSPASPDEPAKASTGSAGLDIILGGGFDAERMYLYEGPPGSGKTTLAGAEDRNHGPAGRRGGA